MADKVDVLAVMDQGATACEAGDYPCTADELREARAAVAELIAVCEGIVTDHDKGRSMRNAAAKLHAALANIGPQS